MLIAARDCFELAELRRFSEAMGTKTTRGQPSARRWFEEVPETCVDDADTLTSI
jgi:hypothetical protein